MELVPCSSNSLPAAAKKDPCQVCGTKRAQSHYGVMSCGACAAFFRRFVNSKKSSSKPCRCDKREIHFICRMCRMDKCIAAGMKICMVKCPLETRQEITSDDELPSIVNINDRIIERSFDRLKSVRINYDLFNLQREALKELNENPAKLNIYELSCILKRDFKRMQRTYEKVYTELRDLSDFEKDAIFTNFYPVCNLFELATLPDSTANQIFPCNPPSLDRYYHRSNEKFTLTADDINRIFLPYWTFFNVYFKKSIQDMKLDSIEIGSIISLRLLDSGYSNLSEKTVELCRSLRKIILRELRSYYIETGASEMRLFEVLEVFALIEKADSKFYEEFLLCEAYGIKLDDDYRRILSVAKL